MTSTTTQPSTVIPSLARWGLTADADLLYRTLVARGPQTCSQVARELGLAPRRTAQALDELAAVGAARPAARLAGHPGYKAERMWVPAPIDWVLATVRRQPARQDTDAERWRRHLAAVDGIDLSAVGSPTVRVLPNLTLTRRRVAVLAAAERYEHIAIQPEQRFTSEALAAARPADRALLDRGIHLRILGLPPADGDLGQSSVNPGESDYREAATLPLKVLVFDRRVAVFPVNPLDLEQGMFEIADPAIVDQFVRLFHRLWDTSHDPRRTGVPPIVLTQRESMIVTLLSRGYNEQSTATQIGLSRRTVQYALRELMDRLGVENSFQLALVLGASGAAPKPTRAAPTPTGAASKSVSSGPRRSEGPAADA